MNRVIRDLMYAGIGGVIAFAVIYLVMTALVTGTDSASNFFRIIVPTVFAAGVVMLIVKLSFTD